MEYILSRQLMMSGTAIGELVREAENVEYKPDFVHKIKNNKMLNTTMLQLLGVIFNFQLSIFN